MALNSYVLIPKGLEAPERAKFLGHSVETNLRYYTHAQSDEYLEELKHILDGNSAENTEKSSTNEVSNPAVPHFDRFYKKKKNPQNVQFIRVLHKKRKRRVWDSNPKVECPEAH